MVFPISLSHLMSLQQYVPLNFNLFGFLVIFLDGDIRPNKYLSLI